MIENKLDKRLTQKFLNVYYPEENAKKQAASSHEKNKENLFIFKNQNFKGSKHFSSRRTDTDSMKEMRNVLYNSSGDSCCMRSTMNFNPN